MYSRSRTKNIVIAGLLLAIGVIVPSIFHSTALPGQILLPMHIPVLLGGFLLPPSLAILLGMLTPLANNLVTGMPLLFPSMVIMIFELGVYGLIASLFYRRLNWNIIISLILAMLMGRVAAGLVVFVLAQFFNIGLDPIIYVKGAIEIGLPGMVIQIILIPTLMYAINRYTTINLD